MDIVGARIEGPIGRLGCRRFHCNHPLLRCLPYKDLRLVPPQDGEAPAPRSSALSPSPASSTVYKLVVSVTWQQGYKWHSWLSSIIKIKSSSRGLLYLWGAEM